MSAAVTKYQVRCEDGAIRHPALFDTPREADVFANWGHCCTNVHAVETVEVPA